jgi:hypothetical protein
MVPQSDTEVKPCDACGRVHATRWDEFKCWIECHPRYAWYWTLILAINTLLNFLDLFGFGGR